MFLEARLSLKDVVLPRSAWMEAEGRKRMGKGFGIHILALLKKGKEISVGMCIKPKGSGEETLPPGGLGAPLVPALPMGSHWQRWDQRWGRCWVKAEAEILPRRRRKQQPASHKKGSDSAFEGGQRGRRHIVIEGNHIREHVAPRELLAQEGPDKAGYLLRFSKKAFRLINRSLNSLFRSSHL